MNEWEVVLKKLQDITKKLEKTMSKQIVGLTTYQQVERILYGYPILDKEIQLLEEEIELYQSRPEEFGFEYKRRSKDTVKGTTQVIEYEKNKLDEAWERLDKKKENFQRLIDTVTKIENDEYFEVIELYYFQGRSEDEVAEQLAISQATVNRQRKRLIKALELVLYGPGEIKI